MPKNDVTVTWSICFTAPTGDDSIELSPVSVSTDVYYVTTSNWGD